MQKQAAGNGQRYNFWAAALVIALMAAIAWANSINAPFVFDDKVNVLENPSIKSLTPIKPVFFAPSGSGNAGRPLLNLSLALNYAISGLSPGSYHATSLLIHIISGILLFGLVRISLTSPRMFPGAGGSAFAPALVTALVWTIHPLTTESVTYITQRAESLMGMFFFLCLYSSVRGFGKRPFNGWHVLAIASFFLGAGSKEVIVSAPPLVLAWDAVFRQKRVTDCLKESWFLYLGLLAGLVGLFILVSLGGTAGADPLNNDIGRLRYLVIQGGVILHYLRLALVPTGQAFDYLDWDTSISAVVLIKAALVGGLVILSAWGLWKRHPAGFAGMWFFLILAPTSSIMPLKCPAYEHRMYLPLAGVAALAVTFFYRVASMHGDRFPESIRKNAGLLGGFFAVAVILCLTVLTIMRNNDYRTDIALWQDTLEKRPSNYRAHINLAQALANAGDLSGAVFHYEKGLPISDLRQRAKAHFNIGNIMAGIGKTDEAIRQYQAAIDNLPVFSEALVNLASAYESKGLHDRAELLYGRAIQFNPNLLEAHFNYAGLLARQGRWGRAAEHYRRALEIAPGLSAASANLAVCVEHMAPQKAMN